LPLRCILFSHHAPPSVLYTLSLHDALPGALPSSRSCRRRLPRTRPFLSTTGAAGGLRRGPAGPQRRAPRLPLLSARVLVGRLPVDHRTPATVAGHAPAADAAGGRASGS